MCSAVLFPIAVAAVVCVAGVGCQESAGTAGTRAAAIRTTHPDIARDNLDAQIAALEARIAAAPGAIAAQADLAALLSSRAQYTGSLADRERALGIGEQLVADHPDDPAALLVRAAGRAGLHLFAAALADVESAQRLGARPAAVDALRAGILQALGRYDEALPLRLALAQRHPDIDALGALASLRAERGESAEATRLYAAARQSYRDVSPFPLAWLSFDEGLMHMRNGDEARALASFADAHDRLPWFAAAQCHRGEMEAALGRTDAAVALLQPLAENGDADAAGQLARILAEAGRAVPARHWRDVAAARYDALMRRYPEAYADHAAEFWLAAGGDPQRALGYARFNLTLRQTPRAHELVRAAEVASAERLARADLHRGAAGRADLPH